MHLMIMFDVTFRRLGVKMERLVTTSSYSVLCMVYIKTDMHLEITWLMSSYNISLLNRKVRDFYIKFLSVLCVMIRRYVTIDGVVFAMSWLGSYLSIKCAKPISTLWSIHVYFVCSCHTLLCPALSRNFEQAAGRASTDGYVSLYNWYFKRR